MVDPQPQFSLAPFQDSIEVVTTREMKTPRRKANPSHESRGTSDSGLDLENLLGFRSRKNFFLDIPFYRTH
jgi:hypothetical protein